MCRTPGAGGIDTFCIEPPASFTSSEANSFALATPLLPLLKEAFPRRGEKAPTAKYSEFQAKRGHPQRATSHGLPQPEYPPFKEHGFLFIPSSPPATRRWDCRRLSAPSSCDSSRLQARVSPGKSRRGAAQPPISSAWSLSQPKLPWPALSAAPCAPAWQPRAAESLRKDFLVPGGKRGLAGVVSVGYFIVFFAVSGRTVCVCKWKVCSLAEAQLLCGGATNLLLSPQSLFLCLSTQGTALSVTPKEGLFPWTAVRELQPALRAATSPLPSSKADK